MNQTTKIRWLIAHEPVDLFLRTARAFQEKISELTNGQYEVEIYTPETCPEECKFADVHGNYCADPIVAMEAGRLEMSQLHITELAFWHSPEFLALELPFLFNDHDHATRVLEGDIGKKMLNDLADRSPVKGLAFTYSGGFRIMASEEGITKLEDLRGKTFATTTNPVTIDTVKVLGAIPESFQIRDFIKKTHGEGHTSTTLETTIPRYLATFNNTSKKYITNTKHSLFLTSIVASNSFWNSLDEDTRAKFEEASLYASRLERKWSVEDAENFASKDDHSDIGVEYTELSASETAKFKELVKPIYDKYVDFFEPGLVDGIIKS